MRETLAQRTLAASTEAWLVAPGCIVMLLPPRVEQAVASVPRVAAVGVLLGCAMAVVAHRA